MVGEAIGRSTAEPAPSHTTLVTLSMDPPIREGKGGIRAEQHEWGDDVTHLRVGDDGLTRRVAEGQRTWAS